MKAYVALALALSVASACSSSDQSLGETRVRPMPEPQPDVDPDPPPAPDPNPMLYACENRALHEHVGICTPKMLPCPDGVITLEGYECAAGLQCCDRRRIGCGSDGCGGTSSGPVLPPGGEATGGTESAGAAG